VCDLETSRIGAPYIYNISCLRVNEKHTENNQQSSGCSLVEHILKATVWKDRGKPLDMSVQLVSQLKNQAGHLINRVRRARMLREIFGMI